MTTTSVTQVVSPALSELDDALQQIYQRDCDNSLLKKYLTQEVFDALKNRTTVSGATLMDLIRSGLANSDSSVGVYAPDAASYYAFAPLLDPIIQDIHKVPPTIIQPATDFGDLATLVNLDPDDKYIISTRIRCARSLAAFPFNSLLGVGGYQGIERLVRPVLEDLPEDLAGQYFPLGGLSRSERRQLIDEHFLFKEGDRFLRAANASRHWPIGRGIFHNKDKTFLVWMNEEDHLRIISMEKGADFRSIYSRWVHALQLLDEKLHFARDERRGWLAFCPSNIGTAVRVSVLIRLPKLERNKARLNQIAAKHHLQVRGTNGEHSEVNGSVFDISNERRLGLSEYDLVKAWQEGVLEIIRAEEDEFVEEVQILQPRV